MSVEAYHIGFEQVADELHDLIRGADADTLSAIYENAFGAVESCKVVWGGLEVVFLEGCEP